MRVYFNVFPFLTLGCNAKRKTSVKVLAIAFFHRALKLRCKQHSDAAVKLE